MNSDNLINLDDPIVGGLDPQTWYTIVKLQIDSLRTHVQGLERQINESVTAYERERIATQIEHDNDGRPFSILEEHRGIESSPTDLEEIFGYYFPNLQRRSTLLILFSFFEHQLDQLCKLFASAQQLNIVHTDLKDKGIDRSRRYLKKVIRLPLDDNSALWQEIKRIQKVRNVVVHNDAKLDPKGNEDVIKIVKEADYLSLASDIESYSYHDIDDDEVNMLEGYLTYVLDTCEAYCGEVNKAIGT